MSATGPATGATGTAGCAGHASLAEELREYADGALDRLAPLVERIREQPVDQAQPEPASCTVCPVCAVITVLRGGRSELAVRLADQFAELLAVLRSALDEGAGARQPGPSAADLRETARPEPSAGETAPPEPQRHQAHRHPAHRTPRVQHISVARDGRSPAAERC